MSDMKKELERLTELRKQLRDIYAEKSELEKAIVAYAVGNDLQKGEMELNDQEVITFAWVFDKKIDYEKLMEQYPDIYELGLKTTFSASQAMLAMDKKLLRKILDDCSVSNPHYEAKVVKKKKRRKNERD